MQLFQILLLFIFSIGIFSCSQEDKPPIHTFESKSTPVSVVKPIFEDVSVTESAIGKIESQFSPNISSEIAGQITQIYAQVGDNVKQGQLLALLDDENLKLLRDTRSAEVARLKAIINHQNLQLKRLQDMVSQKFISESRVDEAKSQLEASQEQLKSAQSQLFITEKNLEKSKIISPLEGIIEKRMVSLGDFVRSGEPLFKITSIQTLLVTFSFPHQIADKIQVGMPLTLTIADQPNFVLQTKVSKISPNINQNTYTVDVICETPYSKSLKPGGQVQGEILLSTQKNTLLIPKSCVVHRPEGEIIYTLSKDKAQKRTVKFGIQKNQLIEITEGLSLNDLVIDDGANFLTNNAPVTLHKSIS